MLKLTRLSVSVNNTPLIHDLSLSVEPGVVHALMGPNGSGKSTLAHVLMGHPAYTITSGDIVFNKENITELSPDKRARAGLFLAFQHPMALPGVRIFTFLQESYAAITGKPVDVRQFAEKLKEYCALLGWDQSVLERNVNEGFSGGEKKRLELLQLLVLQPKLAILDEIDSGLDIDALKMVGRVLAYARTHNPTMSVILITHYQRLLEHIVPDRIHVVCNGRIVESGDMGIVHTLESKGYNAYR